MAKSNERNPHISVIPVGNLGSSATAIVPGIYFRKHSRIKEVRVSNQLSVAKSSTNHVQVQLQDNASSPVAYAAFDSSNAALTSNTAAVLALSTPVGDTANQPEADVPAGTQLNVSLATLGNASLTAAVVQVEYYPV